MYYYKNEEILQLTKEELSDKTIIKTQIAQKNPVSETDFLPLAFGKYFFGIFFKKIQKVDMLKRKSSKHRSLKKQISWLLLLRNPKLLRILN